MPRPKRGEGGEELGGREKQTLQEALPRLLVEPQQTLMWREESEKEAVDWALANVSRKDVRPQDAPGPKSWALLVWASAGKAEFEELVGLWSKLLVGAGKAGGRNGHRFKGGGAGGNESEQAAASGERLRRLLGEGGLDGPVPAEPCPAPEPAKVAVPEAGVAL